MKYFHWLIAHDCEAEEQFPSDPVDLPSSLSEAELDYIERETREAQRREDDRERGVQARLIGLLSLSSLVTAVLSGAVALGSSIVISWPDLVLALVLAAYTYLAIQAIATMSYTATGLMPKKYMKMMPWESADTALVWNRRRRLEKHIRAVRASDWATNRRIDDMNLALGSLKRFAWGSVVLITLLLVALLDQRYRFVSEAVDFVRGIC